METREIVGLVAAVAVIGVVTYALVKDIERTEEQRRLDRNEANRDPFWDSAAERHRINRITIRMAQETDPEVRRELARQLGESRYRRST